MAEEDKIGAIMAKVVKSEALSPVELRELQVRVDQLEVEGLSSSSHHDTYSTVWTHYTHHHDLVRVGGDGVLEMMRDGARTKG